MSGEKILLGAGVVTIGTTPIGLTRGGSIFLVEREIRPIAADGDMGPVVGREVMEGGFQNSSNCLPKDLVVPLHFQNLQSYRNKFYFRNNA